MKVGDRVEFVGPEYTDNPKPKLGQMGTVVRMEGHTAQLFGTVPVTLVTVRFDGDDQDTVVGINRLK
jgi:hypothetical protein